MDTKIKDIIRNSKRYKDFILFDEPVIFDEFYKDTNLDTIQLHSIEVCEGDTEILGFVGICQWINNILLPLDGDTYYSKMKVYGYAWYTIGKDIDILVDDW